MPKKVLIIEDEPPLSKLLSKLLTDQGYATDIALDGAVGLDKALTTHPDLIILDLILPIKHGLEVMKEIRADAWGKNVIIIILTNLSDKKRVQEAKDMGVQEYIVKSGTDLGVVTAKVNEYIARMSSK